MDNKFENENIENENVENGSDEIEAVENPAADGEAESDPTSNIWTTYVPRFTEASEKYRAMGDARLREMMKDIERDEPVDMTNPDEIKLDPTAEFEADVNGVDAKNPENIAIDEDATSMSIYKFTEQEAEPAAPAPERTIDEEYAEIENILLKAIKKEEPVEEEPQEVEVVEEEIEIPDIPDPDENDVEIYESVEEPAENPAERPACYDDGSDALKSSHLHKEYSNPNERDSFKDRFLDSIISIKVRYGVSLFFAIALLVLEILAAVNVLPFGVFSASASASTLGLVDFLVATCIFVMALPEVVRSFGGIAKNRFAPELIAPVAYIVLGLYTLTAVLSGSDSYALFGFMFAIIALPITKASLYRTKADFIAFKMVSQDGEKQIIDKKATRSIDEVNIALDGVVDEYKSTTASTHTTGFVSGFFANTNDTSSVPTNTLLIFGAPLGLGLLAGLISFFVAESFLVGMTVFSLIFMLGCPAFAILSSKVSFFHAQRAALLFESTAVGEHAHYDFSSVDVFTFDDVDIFGPDDVNLKSFMLYRGDSLEKVMRQMCALFAATGGPLDYMFSSAIDNRVRHKMATNVIIEDDGVCGDVMGHRIYAGSEDYMRRNNIAMHQVDNSAQSDSSTIKIMYAAEDGEVYAKFAIRYSFSEEFSRILPELREAGIIPLVYTRDPNVSAELINALSLGGANMRIVKKYTMPKKAEVYPKLRANMVTYGDQIDAASMVVLSKKYRDFTAKTMFIELCAMVIGVILGAVFSFISTAGATVLIASLWQLIWCQFIRIFSNLTFLKKEEQE